MTEEEAYRFVLGVLVLNAKGDGDGIEALAATVGEWDNDTRMMVTQAAISVAFAAHIALAEVAGRPLVEYLEGIALDAAAEVEIEDDEEGA